MEILYLLEGQELWSKRLTARSHAKQTLQAAGTRTMRSALTNFAIPGM